MTRSITERSTVSYAGERVTRLRVEDEDGVLEGTIRVRVVTSTPVDGGVAAWAHVAVEVAGQKAAAETCAVESVEWLARIEARQRAHAIGMALAARMIDDAEIMR